MRTHIRRGGPVSGGITGYPLDRIYEEVAFLAYHLHWDYEIIMNLEHKERLRWCDEVSKINQKLNGEETKNMFEV